MVGARQAQPRGEAARRDNCAPTRTRRSSWRSTRGYSAPQGPASHIRAGIATRTRTLGPAAGRSPLRLSGRLLAVVAAAGTHTHTAAESPHRSSRRACTHSIRQMMSEGLPFLGIGREERELQVDRDSLSASLRRLMAAGRSPRRHQHSAADVMRAEVNPQIAARVGPPSVYNSLPSAARVDADQRVERARDARHCAYRRDPNPRRSHKPSAQA